MFNTYYLPNEKGNWCLVAIVPSLGGINEKLAYDIHIAIARVIGVVNPMWKIVPVKNIRNIKSEIKGDK